MWKLPISPINKNNDNAYLDLDPPNKGVGHTANNLYTLPYKQQQLKYMNQSFFNPPIATIIDAANNNQLQGIPLLGKPDLVRGYLASSAATSKGRMKRQRANTRTTRTKVRPTQTDETAMLEDQFEGAGYNVKGHKGAHWIQPGSQGASNVFCCAALGNAVSGIFYTDMTGAFFRNVFGGKTILFCSL